jgi:LacI family transcriptional regulator
LTGDPVPVAVDWLRKLPKPIGILACNDTRARHISEACHLLGLRVPDDVAIIGVDDDPVACHLASVPITTVVPAFHEVGYAAARLLERILDGHRPPRSPTVIPPKQLIVRRSTDVLAVDDLVLRRALAFVREHACDSIHVNDVVLAAGQSRRQLERRFRDKLGWTIHDEIRRIRLARGKQLLAETDRTVLDIALTVGYSDPKRFTIEFRQAHKQTPSAYRSNFRRL